MDAEWHLSTLFDASLLTSEPPLGGSFFGGDDRRLGLPPDASQIGAETLML